MDIYHYWGSDLQLSSSGDLLTVSDGTEINQRILRALMTFAGEYVWHVKYGVGIGKHVGQPLSPTDFVRIKAAVRAAVIREPNVQQTPPPQISFQANAMGYLVVTIDYTYKPDGKLKSMTFTVSK